MHSTVISVTMLQLTWFDWDRAVGVLHADMHVQSVPTALHVNESTILDLNGLNGKWLVTCTCATLAAATLVVWADQYPPPRYQNTPFLDREHCLAFSCHISATLHVWGLLGRHIYQRHPKPMTAHHLMCKDIILQAYEHTHFLVYLLNNV